MGRTKLHCLRKIQLFVKFSQLLMYLFISAWSGVRFLNPTGRPHHAMQREITIFLYAFWTVRRVVGRNTSWMKNQREPSDGKEATREHGNCVSIFSAFSFTLKCCFPPDVPVIDKVVFFFFPAGRFWRRMNLAPSKPPLRRFFSNPKGKGEYVDTCKEMKHGFTAALKVSPYVLLSLFIPFSVAALPYRCSKSLACLLFKIS